MVRTPGLDPSAFTLQGGPVGCLLLHGYTGSPPEMRLVGEYLNQRGITVSAPLLSGHGTEPEDLNRYKWTDWYADAEEAAEKAVALKLYNAIKDRGIRDEEWKTPR